jgi:uncharacterized protein YsxB (DUF464 family)
LITVTIHNLTYDEELRLPDTDGNVVSIAVEGHAIPGGLFREADDEEKIVTVKGENIICAAVSFAGLNLIRSLTIIAGVRPDHTIENGSMRVSVKTSGLDEGKLSIVRVLLEAFVIGMLDLERRYKSLITLQINQTTTKGR